MKTIAPGIQVAPVSLMTLGTGIPVVTRLSHPGAMPAFVPSRFKFGGISFHPSWKIGIFLGCHKCASAVEIACLARQTNAARMFVRRLVDMLGLADDARCAPRGPPTPSSCGASSPAFQRKGRWARALALARPKQSRSALCFCAAAGHPRAAGPARWPAQSIPPLRKVQAACIFACWVSRALARRGMRR